MALPSSKGDREYNKFVEDALGNVAVRTTATFTGDVNVDSVSNDTSGYIGKASGTNADFTTAYASGTTLTCSGLPTGVTAITAADIVSIQQIATSGAVTNTYTRDDVTITAAGTDPTTLTVTGATFVATDTFIVYTNIPRPVTLNAGDIEIGAVELKNATTDDRADINDANTARTTATHVLAVQGIDAAGNVLDTASLATETTANDIYSEASDINTKTPSLGTAVMTGSVPTTLATDDTQMGAVGAAADVDGNVHGQLRFIGEAVDGLEADIATIAGDTTSLDSKITSCNTGAVVLNPITLASTSALAASLVAKASAGTLYGVSGINNSASAQYIQVHNTASLPADTAVPVIVIKVDAGENFFYAPESPVTMSTGITISNSSTLATKTIGSADCWIQVEYL